MEKYNDAESYRGALLSAGISPRKIMREITIPSTVFKYRSFESGYLEDSLEGNVFFSLPSKINANDPDDCMVAVDEERCRQHLMKNYSRTESEAECIYKMLKERWLDSHDEDGKMVCGLQDQVKIGCFTTVHPQAPESEEMWKTFSGGNGYCMEYETEEKIFYPGAILFLPVCYDSRYDDTEDVLRMMDFIAGKLSSGVEQPELDASFVPHAYNHVLFKPGRYHVEKEWRIIVPRERDAEYFDDIYPTGGKKQMRDCVRRIYVKNSVAGEVSEREAARVRALSQEKGFEVVEC